MFVAVRCVKTCFGLVFHDVSVVQDYSTACGIVEPVSSHASAGNFIPTDVNNVGVLTTCTSPKKPVALPSEATVMVNGEKCVLRVDHSTGHLMACPIAGGM